MKKFPTVGVGLIVIIGLLNIVGWIEWRETQDRWRHCVFLGLDSATTDMELEELSGNCARLTGYERSEEETP